jgi:aminomethyltransferase
MTPSDPTTASPAALLHTPLHALHLELGAKMVPFAGYAMPVSYPQGILAEHRQCRESAVLFDVSHMGQLRLTGDDAAAALETLVPVDIVGLAPGKQRYALFTNDAGGILDDLMVTRRDDHLFLVVNAACKEADTAHLRAHLATRCLIEPLPERALLALQGPKAAAVMQRLAPELAKLTFMTGGEATIRGIACFATRSGYTGEDGFEISVAAAEAESLARALLAEPEVAPAGLGARDTLRLEAGLCLYGHDIDTTTTPVQAGLTWAIQKVRRPEGERAGGYPGADAIAAQLANGAPSKRVGLVGLERVPVREGAHIVDDAGAAIGRVTSGTVGPSVGQPIALAYVPGALAVPGTVVHAEVRGKRQPMRVSPLPFAPHRYFRG